ncbi:ribonuclease E inhibitor RraB [Myxococcota bacterium]|nr:ribonuclease E inhibitor RraB [Myxococcota bacterium]
MRLNPTFVATAFAIGAAVLVGCASPTYSINESDLAVIEQLKSSGSNLDDVHLFNFFLRLPTREMAERAASKLRSKRYTSATRESADGESWYCVAKLMFLPTPRNLAKVRTTLENVARKYGGEYEDYEFVVNR